MASKGFQYFVILYILFTLIQTSFILYKVDQILPSIDTEVKQTGGVADSGIVSLCINTPPVPSFPCNSTIDQNDLTTCQLNVTDPDSSTHIWTGYVLENSSATWFSISSSGFASFNTTNDEVGNWTLAINVSDDSVCGNRLNQSFFPIEILDINDAPELIQPIPNVTLTSGEASNPFVLTNYFTDPDGDTLTFSVSGANEANITIANDSSVRINSAVCDFEDVVYFIASDPYNLTATSNPVIIDCTEDEETPSEDGGSSGGGGGSGGLLFSCKSDWSCIEYIACRPDNTKVNKCVDINGCGDDDELITLDCNYEIEQKKICTEEWLCADWSPCLLNNTQTRLCQDVNKCNTKFDMPETVKSCIYIPTCTDGVKNGDETGTDCGGSCPACKTIESPIIIEDEFNIATALIFMLIFLILIAGMAYHYGHKQIYGTLAKLGLHFAGRVSKMILLQDEQRDKLLARVIKLETELTQKSSQDITKEWIDIAKSYFFLTLGLETDAVKEDLLAMCEDREINEHLKRVLASFFDKTSNIEFSSQTLEGYGLFAIIEELKELILETSNHKQIETEITEYNIPEELYPNEKAYIMLINSYIPLQFNDIIVASEKYMDLLDFYENLTEAAKDQLYEDIARLYQKIRYRASWIENM